MKCQTSAVSDELSYCDNYNQKQPTDQGAEGQSNDQHQEKREYHFGHTREQFQRNEINDRLIAI